MYLIPVYSQRIFHNIACYNLLKFFLKGARELKN